MIEREMGNLRAGKQEGEGGKGEGQGGLASCCVCYMSCCLYFAIIAETGPLGAREIGWYPKQTGVGGAAGRGGGPTRR